MLEPITGGGASEYLFIDSSKTGVSITKNSPVLVDFSSEISTILTSNPDYNFHKILFNGVYASGVYGFYSGRGISSGDNAKKLSITVGETSSYYVYAVVILKHK